MARPTPADLGKTFGLFVRSVGPVEETDKHHSAPGHVVPRPGAIGLFIGVEKVAGSDAEDAGWRWLPEVVAVTHTELSRYRREYDRAIKSGALQRVDAAEYLKWVDAQESGEAATRAKTAEATKAAKPTKSAASGEEGQKP